MKHDKHKAKKSAKYRKQHGIPSGKNENKTEKWTKSTAAESANGGTQRHVQKGGIATAETIEKTSMLIEEQHRIQKYARRKVESNWTKYEDFAVDDEIQVEELPTKPRGEDFQKLIANSDDATSQLRLKDEVWWEEDDQEDETETEIGKLFKIDYVDLSRRLKCIPLHKRLGISTKYFDEDLLNKINEDAAEHAKRYQEMLNAENAKNTDNPSSDIATNHTSRGLSEPSDSTLINSCAKDRLQKVTNKDNCEQAKDAASRTDSDREQCAKNLEQLQVTYDRSSASAESASSSSHFDSQSFNSGSLVISSSKSAISTDVKEPVAELQDKSDEIENLEEWLEGALDL